MRGPHSESVSQRLPRLLRIAGIVVVVATVVGWAIPRWFATVQSRRDVRTELAERYRALRRLDSLSRAMLRDSLRIERAEDELRQNVFLANGPVGGASQFSGVLRSAAEETGLRLRNLSVGIDSASRRRSDGPVRLVRIRARGEVMGDMEGLGRFLATIDAAKPLIGIPSISISTNDVYASPGKPEQLRAEFVMSALVWAVAADTAAQRRPT